MARLKSKKQEITNVCDWYCKVTGGAVKTDKATYLAWNGI